MSRGLVPLYFYSSASGMVESFCARVCDGTGRAFHHLGEREHRTSVPDGPWVLVTPSYKTANAANDTIPEAVRRFLANPVARRRLAGVMSSGNRNFASFYQAAGRQIARVSGRPMLLEFELQGTPWDVDDARRVLAELDQVVLGADKGRDVDPCGFGLTAEQQHPALRRR